LTFKRKPEQMIVLGLVLLIIGFIAKVAILWTIGIILVVVGLVLVVLGSMGRAVGGRRHYY
jgi:uncharacterized membrane protein HdeD (DUF308 family)